MTKFDDTSRKRESDKPEGSVTSSTYPGDEYSIADCYAVKIIDFATMSDHSNPFEGMALKAGEGKKKVNAQSSPSSTAEHSNPFEGMGLMASMLARKEAKEAADRAAEQHDPQSPGRNSDINVAGSPPSSPGAKSASPRQRLQDALGPLDKLLHNSGETSPDASPTEVSPRSSSSSDSPFNVFSPAISPEILRRREEHAEKIKEMQLSALTMNAPTDKEREFARGLTESYAKARAEKTADKTTDKKAKKKYEKRVAKIEKELEAEEEREAEEECEVEEECEAEDESETEDESEAEDEREAHE